MAETVSVILTLNLKNEGVLELASARIGTNARDTTLTREETAEVRHYAYRLLSRDSLPRHLRYVLAFREVGNEVCCVADPLKVVDDGEQPIIPARYSKLPKKIFRDSLKALFPESSDSRGGILLQKISLLEFDHLPSGAGYKFCFKKEVQFHTAPLLEYSCCLPIPGWIWPHHSLPEYASLPEHATVVGRLGTNGFVLDKSIWNVLEETSNFLDTSARLDKGFVALLKGNPGSGKEVFASILHHGGLRRADAPYFPRSMGGRRTNDIQEQLVGRITTDGVHVGSAIVDAANGTLFLDEVEKIMNSEGKPSPRELGSFLLRILEAKKYDPQGAREPKTVENVNWIFAGAKLDASDQDVHLPRDFISRLNGRISIISPLDKERAGEYAAALFLHFTFYFVAKTLGYRELGAPEGKRTYRYHLARWCLARDADPKVWTSCQNITLAAQAVGRAVLAIKTDHSVSARSISRLAERFAQALIRKGEEGGFTAKSPAKTFIDAFVNRAEIDLAALCPPSPRDGKTKGRNGRTVKAHVKS